MGNRKQFSPEVRERAVRLVPDQQGQHSSQWTTTRVDGRRQLKELQRENRELKNTNGILCKASAFFAHAELDRRPK